MNAFELKMHTLSIVASEMHCFKGFLDILTRESDKMT